MSNGFRVVVGVLNFANSISANGSLNRSAQNNSFTDYWLGRWHNEHKWKFLSHFMNNFKICRLYIKEKKAAANSVRDDAKLNIKHEFEEKFTHFQSKSSPIVRSKPLFKHGKIIFGEHIFAKKWFFDFCWVDNRHNCRYWSIENPQWMKKTYEENVNVLTGIVSGHRSLFHWMAVSI